MEETKQFEEETWTSNQLHKRFRSRLYGRRYEIFWSEMFVQGLMHFDSKSLTCTIKKIKELANNASNDVGFPSSWINIMDMNNQLSFHEINEVWKNSWKQLLELIELGKVTSNFDWQININDDWEVESKAEQFNEFVDSNVPMEL